VRRAGIDVGGTKLLGVVVDGAGTVVDECRVSTPTGTEALLATIVDLAGRLAPWDSLGVGLPGLITLEGVIRSSPHLPGVHDVPAQQLLSESLGREVAVDNDATCAAVAEWRIGAGRGVDDVVMVTLGTGIGGGIVAGGRLWRGSNGFSGEFGHSVVDPEGLACPCGRRGCWERYASGSALTGQAQAAAAAGRAQTVLTLAGNDVAAIRGEDVARAAATADAEALALVDDYARWVALGLVNLTNTLDPAMFVLGGGVAATPGVFIGPVERWFASLLYAPEYRPHPTLTFASLGERAGAIGAALLPSIR